MSTTTSIEQLNSEIIQVLCAGIMTTTLLLTNLQSRFPSSGWDLTLLEELLLLGKKQGRFLRQSTNIDRWSVRKNMSIVLPSNVIYQNLCTSTQKVYACSGLGALTDLTTLN